MFDQEMLKPVIISMMVYLVIAKFLPELIKTPTGITMIDDLNMMLIAQKGALASGAVLTGIITLLSQYIIDQEFI